MLTGDPIRTGLVKSLSHPGGNITGLSLLSGDYSVKWLELLKEFVPKLVRVAVLWNPDNPQIVGEVDRLRQAAPVLGLEITALSARPNEIEDTIATIRRAGFDGLVVTDDSSIDLLTSRIVTFAAERHLPAIYPFSNAVRQGGLMSYSADFFELWRRAAGYVDRILKGARPSELPVEQTTAVALKINLRTAKSLGLAIPPTLLARADEVIE
jgi:putative ABC transport system substrate-binding protein